MCSNKEQPNRDKRTILGVRESFDEVQEMVIQLMEEAKYTDHDLFSVRVAFEEALANALLHGHLGDEEAEIEVLWCVTKEQVEIQVIDQGRGYDPEAIPDPTATENLTLPSGRGLAMIRAFMSEVSLNERGNHVTMIRHKEN
ncbi:MAG: ATP-binding protein [Phycisphaerae bacterium]|mgnify:FL=1|jgi:serine/threonine-protein kinase RsbW|nr:ATP-binding protein [Phycisphaerae bacterium]